jgi:hypothetical protein
MAARAQVSYSRTVQQVSEQSRVLSRFKAAMQSHQIDLRLSINHIETIVGCIAKSADAEVRERLPQCNLAISNLRECLSTLQIHWHMFHGWHERHTTLEIDQRRTLPIQWYGDSGSL